MTREYLANMLLVQEYREEPEEILIYQREFQQLRKMEERRNAAIPRLLLMKGRRGSGRRFLLGHVAYECKAKVIYVYMDVLYQCCVEMGTEITVELGELLKEQSGWLCLLENQGGGHEPEHWRELLGLLLGQGISCYLIKEDGVELPEGNYYSYAEVTLSEPDFLQRVRLWEYFLQIYCAGAQVCPESLGSRYRFHAGDIIRILTSACIYRDGEGREVILEEDIRRAVFSTQTQELGSYAKKLHTGYTWDDLVMDEPGKKKLKELCNQVKYRSLVGGAWGFYEKRAYGRGISALFYGPPGTGKTMTARLIANELGLELYRVDLSQMMSKYIGETQKNISSLFEKAACRNIVLLFDEADAFFSKRTSVKDSHDRHANGEVAHLLQQMEDYEGIVILTTNLKDNMDDAFRRRIKMMIEFHLPEAQERLKLWERAFSDRAPRAEDLKLSLYAERFEISGSEIQEIVLQAAFQAAAEDSVIENRHLEEAIRDCYRKYGKVLLEEELR